MTNKEKREQLVANAGGYFKEGLNCSECVFKGYLDLGDSGFPDEIIALASPFGGGIGHTKNTCGALIGACMALGTQMGRKNPLEKETMAERVAELQGEGGIYPYIGDVVGEFVELCGSASCAEITEPYGEFGSVERKKNCKGVIIKAAGIVAERLYPDED